MLNSADSGAPKKKGLQGSFCLRGAVRGCDGSRLENVMGWDSQGMAAAIPRSKPSICRERDTGLKGGGLRGHRTHLQSLQESLAVSSSLLPSAQPQLPLCSAPGEAW